MISMINIRMLTKTILETFDVIYAYAVKFLFIVYLLGCLLFCDAMGSRDDELPVELPILPPRIFGFSNL